tara:strand:+ start:58 stop:507 length:450 start_codon:yes stop_codon:yes gene_type:complete
MPTQIHTQAIADAQVTPAKQSADALERYYYCQDWPEGADQANNTVTRYYWFPVNVQLEKVEVMCISKNTVGTHTLKITDQGSSNTMLSAATFDMTGVTNAVVTNVGLSGTTADLEIPAGTQVKVELTSNNAGFDGSGIYVAFSFVQDLA